MIKINGKSLVKGQINGKEVQKIVINGNTVYNGKKPKNWSVIGSEVKYTAGTTTGVTYTTTILANTKTVICIGIYGRYYGSTTYYSDGTINGSVTQQSQALINNNTLLKALNVTNYPLSSQLQNTLYLTSAEACGQFNIFLNEELIRVAGVNNYYGTDKTFTRTVDPNYTYILFVGGYYTSGFGNNSTFSATVATDGTCDVIKNGVTMDNNATSAGYVMGVKGYGYMIKGATSVTVTVSRNNDNNNFKNQYLLIKLE